MSLLFTESFDGINSTTLAKKWQYYDPGLVGGIGTGYGRYGGKGVYMDYSAELITKPIVATGNEFYVGFAAYQNLYGAGVSSVSCQSIGGGNNCTITWSASGIFLRLGSATGTILDSAPPLNLKIWHYIEFGGILDNSSGILYVKLNNKTILTYSGDTTASTTSCGRLYFAGGGNSCQWFLDDVYWCDGAGSENNTFLGDVNVEVISPNGEGNYKQWTPSTGENWECINEIPASTTDYVSAIPSGYIDSYTFENLSTVSGQVLGINLWIYAQKVGAGFKKYRPFTRVNSTDYYLLLKTLGEGYYYYSYPINVNPDTVSGWTISEINSLETGIKVEG